MKSVRAGSGESLGKIWGKEYKGHIKMSQRKARPARVECGIVIDEARQVE